MMAESAPQQPGQAASGPGQLPEPAGQHNPLERLSGALKDLSADVRELKRTATPFERTKAMENDVYREIDGLRRDIQALSKGVSDTSERHESKLAFLEKESSDMRGLERHIGSIDVAGLRRDIESLGEKQRRLEESVGRMDIDGIVEKLAELDSMLRSLKAASPVIIE
jgi:chromosome segregation ATPase